MRIRHFASLIIVAVCMVLFACGVDFAFPETIIYRVTISSDMFHLFDVFVTYKDADGCDQEVYMRSRSWSAQSFRSNGYKAEMDIRMEAKRDALSGELLSKVFYDMSIDADIIESSFQDESLTKASHTSTFAIKVPVGSSDPDDIDIKVAPLKFDKHFVFCYTVDDPHVNGWSRIFAQFNGMWMDDIEFFHKGLARTTGYQAHPLSITDGCGNDRHFSLGESIWPSVWNENNPNGLIVDNNNSEYNPYIAWSELEVMTDMGNAVYWHDVDEHKWDISDMLSLICGLKEDHAKTLEKTGYPMKTLAQPNGDPRYLEAALYCDLVYMTRATTYPEDISLKTCETLYKKNVYGITTYNDWPIKFQELHEQSVSDDPKLVSMLVHHPGADDLENFKTLCSLYGKDGADNIWITTYDELYEYFDLRKNVKITSHVENGYKIFEITAPDYDDFMYKELTFLITGAAGKAECASSNIYGFSSAVRSDGSVIANCNYSDRNLIMAEKYVSKFEDNSDPMYKTCALYLVSLLREDLQEPFLERLDEVKDPTKEDFPINGKYTKKSMKLYLEFHNGDSIHVEKQY